jgi:magnesium-transporting ATPase (P-type)
MRPVGIPSRVGSRTECALLEFIGNMGANYRALRGESPTLRIFPFSSDRKRMSTVVSMPAMRCMGRWISSCMSMVASVPAVRLRVQTDNFCLLS